MARQVAVLLVIALVLLTVPDLGVQGHIAMVGLTVVVLLALALSGRGIQAMRPQAG